MKRLKRRIIAISTALVMALALVVSFVLADVKAVDDDLYINDDGTASQDIKENSICHMINPNDDFTFSVDKTN